MKHDLAEIAEYVSQDSPRHAANWIRVLRSRFEDIANQPLLYRLRPELGVDARLAPVGQYVILFRVRKDTVTVPHSAVDAGVEAAELGCTGTGLGVGLQEERKAKPKQITA